MKNKIESAVLFIVGIVVGSVGCKKIDRIQIEQNQQMSDKHLSLFLMMNQWVKMKQKKKNLASYFEQKGYYEIAIYGMSYAGETLAGELLGSDIKIKYGIDQKADNIYAEFEVILPENELKTVDAIVVTSITYFNEIEEELSRRIDCPILSLEDIIYEI